MRGTRVRKRRERCMGHDHGFVARDVMMRGGQCLIVGINFRNDNHLMHWSGIRASGVIGDQRWTQLATRQQVATRWTRVWLHHKGREGARDASEEAPQGRG